MKNGMGVWIDHRKAIIVIISAAGEEIKPIISGMEKQIRFSSGSSEDGSTEDVRDRQFQNHLNAYYREVIGVLQDAEAIHIFGPGEAKSELAARLEHEGLHKSIVRVEAVDKMTVPQIAAMVRGLV